MAICAISTPAGIGGIAVVRVSGKDAIEIVDKLFRPFNAKNKLTARAAYTLTYGEIVNPSNEEVLDQVVASLFRAPHSFTGEDVVEVSCHGSIYIQQELLRLLIEQGCRMAKAGEFTQLAYLNGKLDLSQAEAVADLIASTSAASNRIAVQQMKGEFSNKLAELRGQLLNFTSLIELELDFSEEDVEFADRSALRNLAEEIERTLAKLVKSYALGNVLKNGIPTAIVGETNVGKSTLLNYLLNDDRALVSDIHGTTRDTIEDTVNIDGTVFRFIDTAGIRNTDDTVENMGIERTYKKIEQAQIVLWLIDSTKMSQQIDWLAEKIAPLTQDKKVIVVFNKIDKVSEQERKELESLFTNYEHIEQLFISAKKRINTHLLTESLLRAAQVPDIAQGDIIVTNARHHEALVHAHAAILQVMSGLEMNISGDFLTMDVRECLHSLGLITGNEISPDEVLGNIFGRFCIGK